MQMSFFAHETEGILVTLTKINNNDDKDGVSHNINNQHPKQQKQL